MTCGGCREQLNHSKIKVEEGNRKAVFDNSKNEVVHRTRIDGCLKRNEVAADFVISKVSVGDVIVELKGRDVEHAVEQILATAEHMQSCQGARGPIAGLIVCSQYPRADTKYQRLATKFSKKYRGPLHVVTKNDEFEIEKVLSFSGPR